MIIGPFLVRKTKGGLLCLSGIKTGMKVIVAKVIIFNILDEETKDV